MKDWEPENNLSEIMQGYYYTKQFPEIWGRAFLKENRAGGSGTVKIV